MANHYAIAWNPAPVVTHLLMDGARRTVCGVEVVEGWEAGEDYEQDELDSAYVGCLRCSAAAERLARAATKEPTK